MGKSRFSSAVLPFSDRLLDGEQPLEGPELMNYTAKALNGVWSSAPSSSGVAMVLTEKSLALTSANPS
jgi:hypothetical protein